MSDLERFNEEQMKQLALLLSLQDDDQARRIANKIAARVLIARLFEKGMETVPRPASLRDQHDRMARLAEELRDLLGPPTKLKYLLSHDGAAGASDEVVKSIEIIGLKLQAYLSMIALRCTELSLDEDRLRKIYDLMPSTVSHRTTPFIVYLWPNLFDLWQSLGRPLATSAGPLFRFVVFVHECFGLHEVRLSTFRDQVRRHRSGTV